MSPSTLDVRDAREAFALGRLDGRAEGARDLESANIDLALCRGVCERWRKRHASLGRALALVALASVAEAGVILWLAVGR